MKFTTILIPILICGVTTASYPSARNLHQQTAELSNEADISVNIATPLHNTTFQLNASQTGLDLHLHGSSSIGHHQPEVSYIYIIDTSSSTEEPDHPCTSILDCVQNFFLELHQEAISDGSAKLTSVINFDSDATVSAKLLNAEDDAINTAIVSGVSAGSTNCTGALEKATELVNDRSNTADTTIVVFAGDGECNVGLDWESDGDPTLAAKALGDAGAIVHSIAVGENVDCSDTGGYETNYLGDIPQNGGTCHSVPEPHTLPNLIEKLIGAELTRLELQVDGNRTVMLNNTPALPAEGPIEIEFDTTITDLPPGNHSICLHASGIDSLGWRANIRDCHDIVVEAPLAPALAGWAVFLIVAAVMVVLGGTALIARRVAVARAASRNAEKNATAPPGLERNTSKEVV